MIGEIDKPVHQFLFRTVEGATFDVDQFIDGRMRFTGWKTGMSGWLDTSRVQTRHASILRDQFGFAMPVTITFDPIAEGGIVDGWLRHLEGSPAVS